MNFTEDTPATISDVAKKANVSVGTVSRVLNGYTNIATENITRVEKAIKDLGYQRRGNKNSTPFRRPPLHRNIGVIYAEMGEEWANHHLHIDNVRGIDEICALNNYHSLVEWHCDQEVPRCVKDNKVDGLLIRTTRVLPRFLNKLPRNLPVVCIGLNDPLAEIEQVAPDNTGAGWVMTDHLWKKGHRRIAFLSVEGLHPMFIKRYHGYVAYLRQKGAFSSDLVALDPQPGTEHIQQEPPKMDSLFEQVWDRPESERPTAILTANDWMALGLYHTLESKGLRIPEDLSIAGFDNLTPICDALKPSLTSYKIPLNHIAREGTLALLNRIENPGGEHGGRSIHLVRGEIFQRQSVRILTGDNPR